MSSEANAYCNLQCNRIKNIEKFCACKMAANIQYKQLATSGNNPQISKKQLYSKFVKSGSSRSMPVNNINMFFM